MPHPVDVHVGSRVRLRRTLLGMSQGKLAEALGITFQQVQKYERGANRVGSSRLYTIAKILNVPVSYFFEGLEGEEEDVNPYNRRETLELVRGYYKITNPQIRTYVRKLVAEIGGEAEGGE